MATIRRLSDSCLAVTTDEVGVTLLDPGFHPFRSGEVDLDAIGEVQRICITHEHRDHVDPEFVGWLLDRGDDVTVFGNDAVASLLGEHDIAVVTDAPDGTTVEDVVHEPIPTGATPPNRSWTIGDVLTHPGDSHQPTSTAPVLALPLMTPWCSATAAVGFARRLRPAQVVPVHDFALSTDGRAFITGLVKGVLADDGIELLPLGWGDSATV